jgi:hypothetical protein
MIYQVKAKFDFNKSKQFYQALTDGTIGNQRPEGYEIVNSMNRARIDGNGDINWTELCYCPTPLQHERATVYDAYFTNIQTQTIPDHIPMMGSSFIEAISQF